MRHRKYHLIYFFSLFFIISLVSSTTAKTYYLDSLDGKYALQFQISENFTLTNFQGAMLSGKYQLGKRSALRLGISLSFDDASWDRELILSDSVNYFETNKSNSIGITISSQYLSYLVAREDVGFYLGTGPTFGFGVSNKEGEYKVADSTVEKGSGSGDFYTIGLDLIAGVEWSFHKDMTLSAEYGIKFYYNHQTSKSESFRRKEERTNELFGLTYNYINFGISVYF